MPLVKTVITISKVASATYRIVATAVMGYYLVKGVVDHERSKLNAAKAFNSTRPKPRR